VHCPKILLFTWYQTIRVYSITVFPYATAAHHRRRVHQPSMTSSAHTTTTYQAIMSVILGTLIPKVAGLVMFATTSYEA
jgi:hypothetical protein